MEIKRITADDNDVESLAPGTKIVGAWLVGGSDAATADIHDALTVTGNPVISLKAAINTVSSYLYFGSQGIPFKTGISVNLTGTGMILFIVVN